MEKLSIKLRLIPLVPSLCAFVLSCNALTDQISATIDQPERKKISSDASSMNEWGEIETRGRLNLKSKIIVPLDYIPEGSSEMGQLPGCYSPLPNEFGEIGLAKCIDSAISVPITIRHVYQECYNNPVSKKVYPTRKFDLKTCSRIKVLGFKFEPPLQIDIEPLVLK